MKKALLLVWAGLAFLPGISQDASPVTSACTESCRYAYHGGLLVCYDGIGEGCEPDVGRTVGISVSGEVLGLDTVKTDGSLTIALSRFRESELGLMQFFAVIERYVCLSGSYSDTLLWEPDYFIMKKRIRCISHGEKEEISEADYLTDKQLTMQVYPNPAADFVVIRLPKILSGTIHVISSAGVGLRSIPVRERDEILMDVQDLHGTFFIRFTDYSGGIQHHAKLIVIR